MRLFVFLASFVVTCLASADRFEITDLRDDLAQCRRQCSVECRRLARDTSRLVRRVQQDCGFDDQDRRPIEPRGQARLFRSDTCSSSYTGTVDSNTDCEQFARGNGSNVYGIEAGGTCHDIADASLGAACLAFRDMHERSVLLYRSDSCSSSLVAAVDSRTDCAELSNKISANVYAIKTPAGRCLDIADESFAQACARYKSER